MTEKPAPSSRGRKAVIVLLAAALVAALAWVAILLMQQNRDPDQNGQGTTAAPGTSASPGTLGPSATSAAPSPTATASASDLPAAEAATVVWPDPEGTLRHETPEAAAGGFAEELAGFTNPLYGEFMQGDSRSGELEVRASADGAVTTVLLRQLSDGYWYTIGATSSEIKLDSPEAGDRITSPLELSGSSRAFEATVEVVVRSHGTGETLGTGTVMGGSGPDLEPFSGTLEWENPGSGGGVLLLFASSAEDGSVWTAVAVPVGFTTQP